VSISVITVGGQSVKLVSVPSAPGFKLLEYSASDSVATVSSVFTGQLQAQEWPGADLWSWTVTMPKLTAEQADDWISSLLQLRGMANAFQLVDPMHATPRGTVDGTPLIDNAVTGGNAAMSQTLGTKGWTASAAGVLKRGDQIQIGYRLHKILDDVNANVSGEATVSIWPSLREVPTDGGTIITANPAGLFRLATNKRTWSAEPSRLTSLSFPVQEYR
jgi:hypothetical protein